MTCRIHRRRRILDLCLLALVLSCTAAVLAQAPEAAFASLAGTVEDASGGSVPDARVLLTGAPGLHARETATDAQGRFSFANLPASRYTLTVSAAGFAAYTSPAFELSAGAQMEFPLINLAVASASSSVEVTASTQQIAEVEVHAEERQRILGIVPSFYTSYTWQAAPLVPRQKFQLATRSVLDPFSFVGSAITAGIEQEQNTFPGYGDDAAAFGKRYAAAFGDESIGRVFSSAVYPALLHQDPRYFYLGTGSNAARARYAISRVFITRTDSGRNQPNYSLVLGRFTAGALANAYHPHANRGVALTVDNSLLNIAGSTLDNLLREFVFRRITTSVPGFARGKGTQP